MFVGLIIYVMEATFLVFFFLIVLMLDSESKLVVFAKTKGLFLKAFNVNIKAIIIYITN